MYKELKYFCRLYMQALGLYNPVPAAGAPAPAPTVHALQNDPVPAPAGPPPIEPTTTVPPPDEFDPLAIDPIITKKGKTKNVQKNKRP
jgi:hypothetical protein